MNGKPLAKIIILSLTNMFLWFMLRSLDLGKFIRGDEGVMSSGTIAFLCMVYALLAAFVTATVWSQWVAIEEAVKMKNYEKFMQDKDRRIPNTLKFLLSMFSVFVVAAFFFLYFQNGLSGGFSIFAVTMAVLTVWTVIMDLDDPFTGVWNVKVPEDWK